MYKWSYRHSARLLQLHRVCQVLEIPVILPIPLDAQSNWFAGFFDADGTITIAMKHGLPQLSIRVTNKLLQDVESYKVVFGGVSTLIVVKMVTINGLYKVEKMLS